MHTAEPRARRIQILLRSLTALTLIISGVLLYTARSGASDAQPNAASSAPVPAAAATDLGGGFTVTTTAANAQVTTPCPTGKLLEDRFFQTPPSFPFYKVIGPIADSKAAFAPKVGPVYHFGCAVKEPYDIEPPTIAKKCVTFSELNDTLTTHVMACPVDTWVFGEGDLYRPEIQFVTAVGSKLIDGLTGTVWAEGCSAGDVVSISVDGESFAKLPINTKHERQTVVFPGTLTKGTHKFTATCEYTAANKPSPAQRGACVSVVVTDVVSSATDCAVDVYPALSGFSLAGADQVQGACGGYGFVAYRTDATGTVLSSVAAVGANKGDITKLTSSLGTVPTEFFVGTCRIDLAGNTSPTLFCAAANDPQLTQKTCPFKKVSTVGTL